MCLWRPKALTFSSACGRRFQHSFGQTQTYAQVAAPWAIKCFTRAGSQRENPILLVVPCHRVVSADSLTGYAGGLERKRNLLIHEQKLAGHVLFCAVGAAC